MRPTGSNSATWFFAPVAATRPAQARTDTVHSASSRSAWVLGNLAAAGRT